MVQGITCARSQRARQAELQTHLEATLPHILAPCHYASVEGLLRGAKLTSGAPFSLWKPWDGRRPLAKEVKPAFRIPFPPWALPPGLPSSYRLQNVGRRPFRGREHTLIPAGSRLGLWGRCTGEERRLEAPGSAAPQGTAQWCWIFYLVKGNTSGAGAWCSRLCLRLLHQHPMWHRFLSLLF